MHWSYLFLALTHRYYPAKTVQQTVLWHLPGAMKHLLSGVNKSSCFPFVPIIGHITSSTSPWHANHLYDRLNTPYYLTLLGPMFQWQPPARQGRVKVNSSDLAIESWCGGHVWHVPGPDLCSEHPSRLMASAFLRDGYGPKVRQGRSGSTSLMLETEYSNLFGQYRARWCPGPWFNIKMSSYQYRKSHCGDKTVVRSSYLHNGISYTGKMSSLYWIRALAPYVARASAGMALRV